MSEPAEDRIINLAKTVTKARDLIHDDPRSLEKAKALLRRKHREVVEFRVTREDVEKSENEKMVFDTYRLNGITLLREENWEVVLILANQIEVYNQLQKDLNLARSKKDNSFQKLSLEFHLGFAKKLFEVFGKSDPILKKKGKASIAKAFEYMNDHKDQKAIDSLRWFVHRVALGGKMGNGALEFVDPYALIDPNELKK